MRRLRVIVCRGPECGERRASREVHAAFVRALGARGLAERVELGWQSCFGRCTQGPNVLVQALTEDPGVRRFAFATLPLPRGGHSALYNRVTPTDADELIEQHLLAGNRVARLIEPPATSHRSPPAAAAPTDAAPTDPAPVRNRRPDGEG